MCWSVLKNNDRKLNPYYLFQPFSKEEWEQYPFAGEEKSKWFRDAKLGLFLHVGISALGKVDIGWSRYTRKMPDSSNGQIADETYDGWAKELKFEEFDAKEWIKLAKVGGMKYVVIITKHHDGFHMWDTSYSEHKITNSPFERDYIKELTDACHELKMPLGFYYSQRDWFHPDYEPVLPEYVESFSTIPFYKYKPGFSFTVTEKHKKYIEYMHNTIRELMTNYGSIDIFWWDAVWYGGMFEAAMWDAARIEKEIRILQPGIIINNRASLPGDFDTPEGRVGFFQNHRPWETCTPMGTEWAWTGNGVRAFRTILHEFINCICGDGNYLLSIGAMPNGKIDSPETKGIIQLGDWMHKYGESVYGTRGGPWLPSSWGGSTYKNNKVYLHVLNMNDNKTILLPMLDNQVVAVKCLTGENVTYRLKENCLEFTIEKADPEILDILIELTMEKPIEMGIIDIFKDRNKFEIEHAVYGEILLMAEELASERTFTLSDFSKITGVFIQKSEGNVNITSIDENDVQECISMSNQSETALELDIKLFVAGAPICGKKLKQLKLVCDPDAKVHLVKIFGMKNERE